MTDFNPGPWTANLTPLNADLSIDLEAYLAHVRWLLGAGSAGVAALGTTGEANSFSLIERLNLIGVLAKSGIPRERLVIGTGCCALPDTIALTRAVLDAGYTNVLMLPPFYYKGVFEEGIFRAYAQVIESIGDTRLRVLVYDFPQMTGLKISTALLARLQSAFRGIVVGVKNSSGDWSAIPAADAARGRAGLHLRNRQRHHSRLGEADAALARSRRQRAARGSHAHTADAAALSGGSGSQRDHGARNGAGRMESLADAAGQPFGR
jgi:dihydrodipicolinate synthase/N-acetylneuraminate lyase